MATEWDREQKGNKPGKNFQLLFYLTQFFYLCYLLLWTFHVMYKCTYVVAARISPKDIFLQTNQKIHRCSCIAILDSLFSFLLPLHVRNSIVKQSSLSQCYVFVFFFFSAIIGLNEMDDLKFFSIHIYLIYNMMLHHQALHGNCNILHIMQQLKIESFFCGKKKTLLVGLPYQLWSTNENENRSWYSYTVYNICMLALFLRF